MIISDPFLKKRGRPKKNSAEGNIESFGSNSELAEDSSKSLLLVSYQKEHKDFIQFKDQQMLFQMLKRISNSEKVFYDFKSQPILRLLIDTAQELMLDVFEVTVFGIYLERFGTKEHFLPIHDRMLFVAYSAKKFLGSPLAHITEFISRKIKGFEARFYSWEEKFSEYLEVSVVDINETFNVLSRNDFENLVNYNFYVDEILQISPPYQIDFKDNSVKKERKERGKEIIKARFEPKIEDEGKILLNKKEINFLPYQINSDGIFNLINNVCNEHMRSNGLEEIKISQGIEIVNNNSFLNAIAFS